MANIWLVLAGLNGIMAVAAGAYGWHELGDVPEIRTMFMMGSEYQMWHAIALALVGVLFQRTPTRTLNLAGICFQAGIIGFTGTLYTYGLASFIPVEGAAPAGGFLLMSGWALMAWQGLRRRT